MHPVEMILQPLGWALRNRRPNEGASTTRAPELASETRFTLTSPSLADGTVIPAKHCGRFIGAEISPALTWNALPTGTKGLVLVIEDLDSPSSSPGIHTIAAFAPHEGGLPERALTPADAGTQFLRNRRGQAAYLGPRPLPGHGSHRYRFTLSAIDHAVDFPKVSAIEQLPAALDALVLPAGAVTATLTC